MPGMSRMKNCRKWDETRLISARRLAIASPYQNGDVRELVFVTWYSRGAVIDTIEYGGSVDIQSVHNPSVCPPDSSLSNRAGGGSISDGRHIQLNVRCRCLICARQVVEQGRINS